MPGDLDRPGPAVGQVVAVRRQPREETHGLNLVFMGMGEPLLNLEALRDALEILTEQISPRRITVSTAGVVPGIEALAGWPRRPRLAISLHAPDDALRRHLIPTAGGVTIDALIAAGTRYFEVTGRRVTYAYALLEGVNDEPSQARALATRLRGLPVHVNLIPYNPTAGDDLRRPGRARVRAFREVLVAGGVNATVRIERGVEIAAACGQLRTDLVGPRQPVAVDLGADGTVRG